MTDIDPRIAAALDTLSPAGLEPPAWDRLRDRLRSPEVLPVPAQRRKRRIVVVAFAVAAATIGVLLATPAFGVWDRVSQLVGGDVPDDPAAGHMSVFMGVFSDPRTKEDVLPKWMRNRLGERRCSDHERELLGGCIGRGLQKQTRLLIADPAARAGLYAWPTSTGGVCFAWDEGMGGCVLDWTRHARLGMPAAAFIAVEPDEKRPGSRGTILGVVPDDVAGIDVTVSGWSAPMTVQDNGVLFKLPRSCALGNVQDYTIHYRNGTRETVPVDWRHGRRTLGCPNPND